MLKAYIQSHKVIIFMVYDVSVCTEINNGVLTSPVNNDVHRGDPEVIQR